MCSYTCSLFIKLTIRNEYSRRLENVLQQIETVENNLNKNLIQEFSKYLISKDTSANYQRNCIKVILMFADFLQSTKKGGKQYKFSLNKLQIEH